MLTDAVEQFNPSQCKELLNDRMDQEDENSNTYITPSDLTMTQESTCCMQNERIILESQKLLLSNHILENRFIWSVLDIIRMALCSQKWYEEKLGIFNCQLCKYISKESAGFFEHVANKDHLDKMTLGKSLFEKKLLIFSLLDDLDVCIVQINSLDPNSFSDAVSDKIVKRNILKALRLAIFTIRSEEEKIVSYAKKQLLQKETNLENDVRKVAQQVSADESCFAELLAILNEYHWHQQEESGSFRCLLCGTNLLKFHNFILHVSSTIHLDKVCDGKTVNVKKQIVREILNAVNDCAFRVKNFDLQNATSSDLISFKRIVEINLNKSEAVIKEKLLNLEEQHEEKNIVGNSEGNTINEESDLSLLDGQKSEVLLKETNTKKVQEEVIGEDRTQFISAEKVSALTEKGYPASVDDKHCLEKDDHEPSEIDSYINRTEQAIDSRLLEIASKNNLWPDESLHCYLCPAEVNGCGTKLKHFLGQNHLDKLLDGNSFSKKQEIFRGQYDSICNCEQDFKAINIHDCDRIKTYIMWLTKEKLLLLKKIWPPFQPILDATTTRSIILEYLKSCGKVHFFDNKIHCQTCNMYFSFCALDFIPHIVGVLHIRNFCDGKDIQEKEKVLWKLCRRLLECETQVNILLIEDGSMKNKILLALDEALTTLDTKLRDFVPKSRINFWSHSVNKKEDDCRKETFNWRDDSVEMSSRTSVNHEQDECNGGSAEKNSEGFDEENILFSFPSVADCDNGIAEELETSDGVEEENQKTEKSEMRDFSAGVGNSAYTSDFPNDGYFILTCEDCESEFVIFNNDVQLSYDIHAQSDSHQLAVMKPLERSSQEAAQVVEAEVSLKPTPIDIADDLVLEILVEQKLFSEESEGSFCDVCKVSVYGSVGKRLAHYLGEDHLKIFLAGKCASEEKQTCIEFQKIIFNCEAELKILETEGYTKRALFLHMFKRSKSRLSKRIKTVSLELNVECLVKQSGLKLNKSNNAGSLRKTIVECLEVCGSIPCISGKFDCISCPDVSISHPQDFIVHVVGAHHIKQICDGLDRNGRVEAMQSLQYKLKYFVLKLSGINSNKKSRKTKLLCALKKAEKHLETLLTSSENVVNQNCTIGNGEVAINKGKLIDFVDSKCNMDKADDQELLVSLKALIQCPISHFYSNVKPDNSYFCGSCNVELTFPSICSGLSILKHIVSFEHMSVAQNEETLSLKIEHIEEILNTIENLKPNVVAYIKRSNFAKLCKVVRKVKKEITFVKTFETDFWDFVSKLKNVPVCNYVSDRDTLKVVQIVSHPSCIDQYVGLEDIQFMHFNLAILRERLSGFSMPVFRKEIEEAVFHLSIGGQRVAEILRELSN